MSADRFPDVDCNLFPEFDCIFAPSSASNETAQVAPNGLADLPVESRSSSQFDSLFTPDTNIDVPKGEIISPAPSHPSFVGINHPRDIDIGLNIFPDNLFPEFDCIFTPVPASNETAQVAPNGLADPPVESRISSEFDSFFAPDENIDVPEGEIISPAPSHSSFVGINHPRDIDIGLNIFPKSNNCFKSESSFASKRRRLYAYPTTQIAPHNGAACASDDKRLDTLNVSANLFPEFDSFFRESEDHNHFTKPCESDSAKRRRLDTRPTLQTESFDDKRQRFSTRLARVSHSPTNNTVADYEGRPPGPDSLLFGSRPESFHNWQSNIPNHFSPEVDRVPGRPPENV